jgi:hypothetical protein
MSYLYGDSTPSQMEVNYIEVLRDVVDLCVQVLSADQRVAKGRERLRVLGEETAIEAERLQKLDTLVARAFDGAASDIGAAESASARCAEAIRRSAGELVRAETASLRAAYDSESAGRAAEEAREREGGVKALETLLIKHELPATAVDLHLAVSGGTRYACRALAKTSFGLDAVFELDVPVNNPFERVVRIDRLVDRLEIQAPEIGGWLHKEVKLRPQHLDKHHVAELSIAAGADGECVLKLRSGADGTGSGFDVTFAKGVNEEGGVRLTRVEPQGKTTEESFDAEEVDARKLRVVLDKLVKASAELKAHRLRLVEAKLDGEDLRTHARPTLLIERLVGTIAPAVQEIASRSQSREELVLRRLLSGDRREEIFVSKSELKGKLDPLSDENRTFFEPLWVVPPPGTSKAQHVSVTVPAPTPRRLPTPAFGTFVTAPSPPPPPPPSAAARTVVTGEVQDKDDASLPSLLGSIAEAAAAAAKTSAGADLTDTSGRIEISIVEASDSIPTRS